MKVRYKGFVRDHVMLGIAYLGLAGMAIMVATIAYTAFTSPLGMGDPLIGRLLGVPR